MFNKYIYRIIFSAMSHDQFMQYISHLCICTLCIMHYKTEYIMENLFYHIEIDVVAMHQNKVISQKPYNIFGGVS